MAKAGTSATSATGTKPETTRSGTTRPGSKKSDLKTKPVGDSLAEAKASVDAFLAGLDDPVKRADSQTLIALMRGATGAQPTLWGNSLIGFGRYHYRYDSGHEGDAFIVGFSPRKAAMTLYVMPGFDTYAPLLARLGKHTTGKSCLYVKRLADVDAAVLGDLVADSVAAMREKHPDAS